MKHSNLLLSCVGFLAATQIVSASSQAEPFEVIARENVFRLRAPVPEEKPVSIINRPQIILQGFTTILGRAQVLLNIQTTGAAGAACVLSENENHDGVTILQINVKSETVRLNNLGLEQIVALKR